MDNLSAKFLNEISTHLKLRLADAIHNLKWVKIIKIDQIRGQVFLNFTLMGHISL